MRRTIPIVSALALAAVSALLPVSTRSAGAADGVVDLPVSFAVKNTNTSRVPCPSDGKAYTVKGHIVAPAAALESPKAATLYLHAVTWGAHYWHLQNIPGYDYASNMAEKGHVSVIVDRLGYGASGKPAGSGGTCFGSEADVAHQMVQALKSGNYTLSGHAPVPFSKVFIAGSSVGGMTAEIENYSYKDTDGIINWGWAEYRFSQYALREAGDYGRRCSMGGDSGAPAYYATFALNSIETFWFNSATPEVRAQLPRATPDPCSQIASIPPSVMTDEMHKREIKVPVLSIFGDADSIFSPQAAKEAAAEFSGSPDSTLVMIAGASHFPLVEANHLDAEAAVDAFLDKYSG
jgi:pimeloyl-ACP methyl ester carboxylesterase